MVCKMCYCLYICCSLNATFEVTDTKLYILVVTLSTQDNAKLLKQLDPGFKREVN